MRLDGPVSVVVRGDLDVVRGGILGFVLNLERTEGVQFAAADRASLQIEDAQLGAAQQGFLEHIGRVAGSAEVGHEQGGHARGMRAGLRGAAHIVITIGRNRAHNPLFVGCIGIGTARGENIHPGPVIGE